MYYFLQMSVTQAFVGSMVHSLEGSHGLEIKDDHVLVIQNGKVIPKILIQNRVYSKKPLYRLLALSRKQSSKNWSRSIMLQRQMLWKWLKGNLRLNI